jgi:cytochrome P450
MDGQAPAPMDWDPFAPDFMAVHAELRARCPVAHTARLGGFWGITRYADIVAAARDTSTFISSKGMTLPQLGNIVQQVPIELDPPLHSVYRRILQPYFLPDYLARLESDIRSLTNELLEPLISSSTGDVVEHLSFPLPARVLCLWLNLPASTWLRLKGFAEETIRTRTTGDMEGNRVVESAINAFIRELFAERRATPRDPATDLLSGLLAARVDGRPLEDLMLVGAVRTLLTAGHSSTTNGLGNSILYLAEHPHEQARLRANPGLLPTAIEELLRYEAPIQAIGRTVSREVEFAGQAMDEGERVGLLWVSGNRDETAFPAADQCVLDRTPNRHLAFGYGIHKCIGAELARMELRVALEELLGRTREFSVGGPVRRVGWPAVGVARLPLTLVV